MFNHFEYTDVECFSSVNSLNSTSKFSRDVLGHTEKVREEIQEMLELRSDVELPKLMQENPGEVLKAIEKKKKEIQAQRERLGMISTSKEPKEKASLDGGNPLVNRAISNEIEEITSENASPQKHSQVDSMEPQDLIPMKEEAFYKELEADYQKEIENLYRDGARPADIIRNKSGFGVKETEQISIEDQELINSIKDLNLAAIHEFLSEFHGESIASIVKHANGEELDALTKLTLYYLTQSGKKAFSIPDPELPNLYRKIRGIYEHHYSFRDDVKDAISIIKYTERYSKLKSLAVKKKSLKGLTRRVTKRIYHFLSYSFRPSHRTRFLKQKMTKTFEMEGPRKEHIEVKYGSPKLEIYIHVKKVSEVNKDIQQQTGADTGTQQDQGITLHGRRGREQKQLAVIIDRRKKYQSKLDALKLEAVKGKLSHERIRWEMTTLFNECAEKPQFRTEIGKIRIQVAKDTLVSYSEIVKNNGIQDIKYDIGELKLENQKELHRLEESLKKTIKKYGSNSLRSWLNDIASDGGALFTVVTTSLAIGGCVT